MAKHNILTVDEIKTILADIASGLTLAAACKKAGRDQSNVWLRIWGDAELAKEYARAQDTGVEARLDEAFTAARDEPDVQRARLIADNAKWFASKRMARQYGDKTQLVGDGEDSAITIKIVE